MRRFLNSVISVLYSFFRLCLMKIFYGKALHFSPIERISPNVILECSRGGYFVWVKNVGFTQVAS